MRCADAGVLPACLPARQVVPVFNFRRVDLLMRQWDVRQGRLEAAEFKLRQTGERPMVNQKGCWGGPKVRKSTPGYLGGPGCWAAHDVQQYGS